MKETFGQGMQDYLNAARTDPMSVCVVEVEKVVRKSDVHSMLVQWRAEDVKSAAGATAILSVTDALILILLQLRLQRKTLVTEISETYLQLTPTHRKILGMQYHDRNEDGQIYTRVWEAIQRLIRLVDEFPGRKDKKLNKREFGELLDARDGEDCEMRRERMFRLANALLEGTRLCLPKEIRDRSDGSIGLDATVLELYGKLGNPSSKNREADRLSVNCDGGWYGREGDHAAMTKADAAELNKRKPGSKAKGSSTKDMKWGIEIEVARQVANFGTDQLTFPLLTLGWSAHIPGAIRGEAVRIADSLLERGHKAGFWIVDRAYPNGRVREYAIPIRERGYKHVFSYMRNDIGAGALDARGFIQISGSWYLDTLPQVLRDADLAIYDARASWFATQKKFVKSPNPSPDAQLAYDVAKKSYRAAEDLFAQQFDRRLKSRLKPKGRMDEKWNRRYLIPTDSPDYLKWKAKPGAHQGATVEMKCPTDEQFNTDPNAGGLKREQHFPWGGPDWQEVSGKRNGVESLNANVKRSQFEGVGDASLRAVRGNTFTYLVSAFALVTENLRSMLSFFKRELAQKNLTAKNNKIAATFWQADTSIVDDTRSLEPPS